MRHSRWRLGMAFGVSLMLALPLAAAAGSESGKGSPAIGRDFRIGGNGATEWDDEPAVAWNEEEGQFLVVWADPRNGGSDIYGRRVAADTGKPEGPDLRISGAGATGLEACPDVAWSATSDVFLVVWQDGRNMASMDAEIYGRLVGADGKPSGPDFLINGPVSPDSDVCPAVAWGSKSDQFLVVWESNRDHWLKGSEIYGRLIGADAKPVGAALVVSGTGAVEDDRNAAVAWNATSNQFLVVWEDYRNQASWAADIYGRRVTAAGSPTGADFRISGPGGTKDEVEPEVAWNATENQYLVVWEDTRGSGGARGEDIYGRLVGGASGMASGEKRISGAKATSDETDPEVAWDEPADQYLVVWEDSRDIAVGRNTDIRGQKLDAAGFRSGADFRLSGAGGTWAESHPDVACGAGADPVQFLVAWSDMRNFATHRADIYGRRVEG